MKSEFHSSEDINSIVFTCCVLHNMILFDDGAHEQGTKERKKIAPNQTRTNVFSLRPFAVLSNGEQALVQAIIADHLARETGRPAESDDNRACARAVTALPMMRLDASLNHTNSP